MTTAERREAILAQLGRKPIAARTLAAKYGVSRQVIVQDLAVLRAAHPNVISTARGYVRQQAESACTREFKVRHTPAQTGLELINAFGTVRNGTAMLEFDAETRIAFVGIETLAELRQIGAAGGVRDAAFANAGPDARRPAGQMDLGTGGAGRSAARRDCPRAGVPVQPLR